MNDREFIAVFHYDNGGTNRCGAEPYRYAEEIVRCKECKWLRYCETEDLDLYLDCDKPDGGGVPRNEDWFCADGEVRDLNVVTELKPTLLTTTSALTVVRI